MTNLYQLIEGQNDYHKCASTHWGQLSINIDKNSIEISCQKEGCKNEK